MINTYWVHLQYSLTEKNKVAIWYGRESVKLRATKGEGFDFLLFVVDTSDVTEEVNALAKKIHYYHNLQPSKIIRLRRESGPLLSQYLDTSQNYSWKEINEYIELLALCIQGQKYFVL